MARIAIPDRLRKQHTVQIKLSKIELEAVKKSMRKNGHIYITDLIRAALTAYIGGRRA